MPPWRRSGYMHISDRVSAQRVVRWKIGFRCEGHSAIFDQNIYVAEIGRDPEIQTDVLGRGSRRVYRRHLAGSELRCRVKSISIWAPLRPDFAQNADFRRYQGHFWPRFWAKYTQKIHRWPSFWLYEEKSVRIRRHQAGPDRQFDHLQDSVGCCLSGGQNQIHWYEPWRRSAFQHLWPEKRCFQKFRNRPRSPGTFWLPDWRPPKQQKRRLHSTSPFGWFPRVGLEKWPQNRQ